MEYPSIDHSSIAHATLWHSICVVAHSVRYILLDRYIMIQPQRQSEDSALLLYKAQNSEISLESFMFMNAKFGH